MEFILPTMTCGHCVRTITEAVQQLDPNARVVIDLPSRRLQVQTGVDQSRVREALVEAGYEPQ